MEGAIEDIYDGSGFKRLVDQENGLRPPHDWGDGTILNSAALFSLARCNPKLAFQLVFVADLRVGMEHGANRAICDKLPLLDIVPHPAFDDVMLFLRQF